MKPNVSATLLGLNLMALAASASAQAPVIDAKKMSLPVIDGTIGIQEWKDAATFHGLVDSVTGRPAPETADFWLGYDDKNVYFAARMPDSKPKEIRAIEYRANTGMSGDDTVGIALDLSGSISDFSNFSVNAKGATNISIAGGRGLKREWTGDIVSRGRITETGWEVEVKIPWRILPLPKPGKRDVRVNAYRYISRLGRSFTYAFTEVAANTPIWRGVEIPKSGTDRSVKLLPYSYFGAGKGSPPIFNSGLDWKAGLTNQIFAAGTINPDDRNIQNSILSLDFSRFARIGAETRPFFQEGAGYLSNSIFVSQVIPQFDVGTQVYGKVNDKTQFGILNAEQFGRQSDNVFNTNIAPDPTQYVNVAVTNQTRPGDNNDAFAYAYSKRMGPWAAYFAQSGSQDSVLGRGVSGSGGFNYFKGGLSAGAGYSETTSSYAPALGFTTETDLKGPNGAAFYDRLYSSGPLRELDAGFYASDMTRLDGQAYRNDAGGSFYITTRKGFSIGTSVDFPTFEGSHDATETISAYYPTTDPYRNASISYTGGHINGDPYKDLNLGIAVRPRKGLQINVTYQVVNLPTWQDQTIASLSWDIGHDQTIGGRAVEIDGRVNVFLTYTRSGNLGAEYYLIVGDPNAATFQPSLILKVVVPIKL